MGRKKRGKKKLGINQLKSVLLKYFLKNPKKRMNAGQLIKKLSLSNSRDSVSHALSELHRDDNIRSVSDHKYVLNKRKLKEEPADQGTDKTYVGKVEIIRSGSAYVVVPDLEKDVYVPRRYLASAMNGDRVELAVRFYRSKNPEGRVTKVIERNTSRVIGKLRASRSSGVVVWQTKRNTVEVFISSQNFGAAVDGDTVIVDIVSWGDENNNTVWGKVVRIVNDLDYHDFTMESILIENGFKSDYPDEVLKELEGISENISEEELLKRRDFREHICFTIDPDTAKDFDDAISYKILENGHHEIGVHIADVTHYLKEKTALDKEAYTRSTSVYLVDRCIAMLPEKLSNNLCSLVPDQDRLVFSAVFEFDPNFKLINEWFGKSVIHSKRRFTYEEAQEIMDSNAGEFHKELGLLNEIAKHLRDQRFKDGGIGFETDEVKFRLDKDNKPIGVFVKERKEVHMLIEDFMLLANRRVARFVSEKSKENPIPFVYRIHDLPDMDRLVDLKYLLEEYDVQMDLSTPSKIAKSFNTLSEKAQKEEKYKLLMGFAIRTMAKAIYSTDNIGHYGLGFEYYTHFTSPIRRYSDVLVHRILENTLNKASRPNKATLAAQCVHISSQERKAMDAERDSVKFKQVEYMSEHIGEEFEGMISGMIDKGIFVELGDTKAEGLIPFERLGDRFLVKENKIKALGLRKGKDLKLGDRLKVKIIDADLRNRLIEMELVEYL